MDSFFLFVRPGLPGMNGQPGLPGLPGAKVNLIDYRLLSFLLSYFFIQGQRGETAIATISGAPGNPGPKGVTGERGSPGVSGQRKLSKNCLMLI